MSLILLESEKLISENVLDSSDEPNNFINIFRKPIKINKDDTFELVSMAFNKNATIVLTATCNTMRWRIGNSQQYSNHDITISPGTYSPDTLAEEIKSKLNASVLINIYQFDCIYANQKITISFSQIDTPDLPNSSDGIAIVRNETADFVDVKVDEKELTDKSFLTNSELEVDASVSSTIDNPLELDYLISPNQPVFANGGGGFLALNPQILINGVNVGDAITGAVTMTEGSTSEPWVAYTGSNGYEFKWDGKFYRFAGSVPEINLRDGSVDLKFYERGLTLIEADNDVALPSSITTGTSGFRLLTIVLTTTEVATGTTASDFKVNRSVLSITNQRGYPARTLSVLDLQTYLNFKRLGYKNGLVALSKNSEFATDDFESDFLKTDSDYQLLITQENLDTNTDKVKVKVHAYRTVSTSHSTPQEITLKIGDQSFASGVDITTVLNKIVVNETGSKMDSIQLGLTLSKVTGDIVFEIKCDENGSGVFTKDFKDIRLSADCGIAQKFKESMFPIHCLYGMGTGSYGQNLNPDIYQMEGVYSTLENTITSTSLVSTNVITADAVENTTVSAGELLGDPVAKNYIFIMNKVPDENISSSATNNPNLLTPTDVGNNNFTLGKVLNMDSFKKGISAIAGDITSNDPLMNNTHTSNIHVQIPDLPLDSYNGVLGQPENTIAIIPGEQIQTEDTTGKLYHQASMSNKISLNLTQDKLIDSMRVKLTNSTGTLVQGLSHPTSVIIKLNRQK